MTDFLSAALPWVLIGISVAIIAANFGRKKRKLNTKKQGNLDEENSNIDDPKDYTSVGMCLGMCIGTVFSSTGIAPLSYGISFGMLIGTVVGMCIKKG